nr:hypothetical protein [Enterococcus faecium]
MITVRVSDAKKEWLSYMAEFYGITLSELLKNYSMEYPTTEKKKPCQEPCHHWWCFALFTGLFVCCIFHARGN